MDDIKQKLDEILDTERRGIRKKLDEAREKSQSGPGEMTLEIQQRLLKNIEDRAARNQAKLDRLPPDVGGRIKELSNYCFRNNECQVICTGSKRDDGTGKRIEESS